MVSSQPVPTDCCVYYGRVPLDNGVCNGCSLFLDTCSPIVTSIDGYSASSECDRFLCEGCSDTNCLFRD